MPYYTKEEAIEALLKHTGGPDFTFETLFGEKHYGYIKTQYTNKVELKIYHISTDLSKYDIVSNKFILDTHKSKFGVFVLINQKRVYIERRVK